MRVNGYGVRPGNSGYNGQQRSGDEFNRDYKQVRYVRAEEYASRDVKEYHHYEEQQDLTKERPEEEKRRDKKSDKSKSSKNSNIIRVQAIQQVVVAIVGAAVVATSYQTAVAKRAEKQVEDPTSSVVQTTDDTGSEDNLAPTASWEWAEDNQSAVLILTDSEGNIIAKIPATITTEEDPAGCNTVGKLTYIAKAESEGNEYSDTREKELPPLGHDFDSGTEVSLDNGQTAMDFTCQRCGEHFTVQNSINEE